MRKRKHNKITRIDELRFKYNFNKKGAKMLFYLNEVQEKEND